MIERVEVRNFQSLKHVVVEPARFTVIVGPSNVGKSAFTRAIRVLTSNRRGAEFITHGERVATISATTDKGHVTLKRGKAPGDNEYVVVPSDPQHPLYPRREFSKLGGATPPEVSEFIGIDAQDPINYAGQFDKPYLLDDPAGEVARTLGALTNVNVIFEAARESNRRTLAHGATLRTRVADLASVRDKVPAYAGLKTQRAALERAELALDRARVLKRQISKLSEAVEALEGAEALVRRLAPYLALKVPDEQSVIDAEARLSAYRGAVGELQAATTARTAASLALDAVEGEERTLTDEWNAALRSMAGGISGYYAVHSETMEDRAPHGAVIMEAPEAARLAAEYVAGVLSE